VSSKFVLLRLLLLVTLGLLLIGIWLARPVQAEGPIHVDADATCDPCDGTSWSSAYPHLQGALSQAASGDKIWVAEGVYTSNWTDFTFAAWVNWHGGGNPYWQRVFDFGHEPDPGLDPSHYMFLTPRSISDTLRFAITTGSWSAEEELEYTSPLTPSQWVHLVVTLAGDTGTLYVDGQPVDTQTITLNPNDVVGPNMWLGRSQWSWDPYFDGLMDEVAVFDRALNAAEIAAVYNTGWQAQAGQLLGLHFDEAAGATTFDDASSNNNDAWCTDPYCPTAGVASGVYSPALEFTGTLTHYVSLPATMSRSTTFQLVDGVALYGGFAGTETSRGQRDWQKNVTVLSGDLDGDDLTDAHDVITHTDHISGTNSYHVVTSRGVTDTAVLDGFTLTGGNANGSFLNDVGGGMFNEDSSPTVRNVIFSGNTADYNGGGMFNNNGSDPTLTNVTFNGNTAVNYGGGMFSNSSNPTLTSVTFSGNSAQYGGGMFNGLSNPTLTSVTFSGNSAQYGGGMYNYSGKPTLTNVTFSGNSATQWGGGMINDDSSSPTLTNVTFSGNTAWSNGGGMYNEFSTPTLVNVTFSGNTAYNGGGMFNGFSNTTLTNCILWGNTATNGAQIHNVSSSPTISYSLVWGGWGGTGNIDADPQFVRNPDPGDGDWTTPGDNDYGDLRLRLTSPAIDAGDNIALPLDPFDLDGDGNTAELLPLDLDGYPRCVDIPDVPDTGVGPAPIVDMGACEAQDVSPVHLPLILKNYP
jgi:hypothetical protein